jgi:glycosyltransferase involved in cell wall biosynthesis
VQPDIVHLNSFREAAFDFGVPVLAVAHSCVASWWQACRPRQTMEPRWHIYLRNAAEGLNAAERWAAPTMSYRDWIESFYRPRTRGEVVWNGSEPAPRTTAKQKSILAAGRLWDEAKNLRVLSEVAADVDWPISVAGPLQSAGDAPAAKSGNLHVLGQMAHDDLLARMQRAGIFVAPALYEPFGLGILEAAGRGCPLVLSDIASLRELWRGAALFVEPTNADALRASLNRLCRDGALRERLGAAARHRAQRYSLDAMVQAYRRIYRDLLQPDARPRHALARPVELRQ